MARADLHIHTRVSDGLASVQAILERAEHETDLDVIAVTDHEDVTGGLRAREVAASRGYRVQVVPGAEVTTLHGHLLALFVEQTPPLLRSMERTLEDVHARGGLAVVPHPLSWLTRSISRRTLDRVTRRGEPGVVFDAIELGNPSPAGRVTVAKARALNAGWGLPAVGGSDAHHLLHLGTGWTEFDGRTSEDLERAIREGAVGAGSRPYPSAREVGYARVLSGFAWGYAATPRKLAARAGRLNPWRNGKGSRTKPCA